VDTFEEEVEPLPDIVSKINETTDAELKEFLKNFKG